MKDHETEAGWQSRDVLSGKVSTDLMIQWGPRRTGQTDTQEISIQNAVVGDGVQVAGTTLAVRDGKEDKTHVAQSQTQNSHACWGWEGIMYLRRQLSQLLKQAVF